MKRLPHAIRTLPRRVAETMTVFCLPGGRRLAPFMWQVTGYLFPQEAAFLRHLAAHGPGTGAVVEIGSMHGLSTLCLAEGLRQRGTAERVVAIDPHPDGSEAVLRANLARFDAEELVRVVVGRSEEVAASWDAPVRLIFIDGDHTLEAVTIDFESWLPFVEPGGYLLLHDSTGLSGFDGPRLLAGAKMRLGATFDRIGTVGSITWGRRRGSDSEWAPRLKGAGTCDTLFRVAKGGSATAG